MTVLSDLPDMPLYDPGRLHIISLGVYVELKPFRNLYFSGRLQHGGTPSIAPPDIQVEPWHYRMVAVAYPPAKLLCGSTRHAFASVSLKGDPLCITPEMTGLR